MGTHDVKLLVELADYPELTAAIGLEISFQVLVNSVCEQAYLFMRETPKMWHMLTEPPTEATLGVSDSVSPGGYSLCGKRVYNVNPSPYMSVDEQIGDRVTLLLEGGYPFFMSNIDFRAARGSFAEKQAPPLMAEVEVYLEEYPAMQRYTFTFPVYVLPPCDYSYIMMVGFKALNYYTISQPPFK